MKRPKLRYLNDAERQAVQWWKSNYGKDAWPEALRDRPSITSGGFAKVCREVWINRPYGNPWMCLMRQRARMVFRRAAYFRHLPCYLNGKP